MAEPSVLDDSEAHSAAAVRMLDVAEQLFARKGIDNVSNREILRDSGQGNLSAVLYHFGSRDALVGALLSRRIRFINALRQRRLDELDASGRVPTVHALVSLAIRALADTVLTQPWAPAYVCVSAQALFSPGIAFGKLVMPDAWGPQNRLVAALRQLLPHLPEAVFRERIRILTYESVYSVARWVQAHGAPTGRNRPKFEAMVSATTDFLAAGMDAPGGAE